MEFSAAPGEKPVIKTERLTLRRLAVADAPFILKLLNDPSFIKHVGDRRIRTFADAEGYIRSGPMAGHQQHGFGLDCVEEKASGRAIGICGLLKRPALEDVDVGYAFLPQFRSMGYAREAVRATMSHAKSGLGLSRLAAIVNPGNQTSIRLLKDLGFRYEKRVCPEKDKKEVEYYLCRL